MSTVKTKVADQKSVTIRLNSDEYQSLASQAQKRGLSVNGFAATLVKGELSEPDAPLAISAELLAATYALIRSIEQPTDAAELRSVAQCLAKHAIQLIQSTRPLA